MTAETKEIIKSDPKLDYWGDKQVIAKAANRVIAIMPGGDKLTVSQAMAVAQAAIFSDANFMRGDIYGYQDARGNLVLVDGYKLLVREAKRICDYRTFTYPLSEEEARAHGIDPAKDIACWVYILRDDKRADYQFEVREAKEFGMGYHEARRAALDYTASKAVGVVWKSDMWSEKNHKPINPPKNMTWVEKAEQRGLKQALRKAYALPSPKELAQRAMIVDGTETQPCDWQGVEQYDSPEVRSTAAKLAAWDRENEEAWNAMPREEQRAKFAANVAVMRGLDDEIE